ncbi:MAG: hypothetical protein IH851_11870 [Armatimonadetes bacterium]|nr:hypothetical protein [Armatimonadota bacterium]
MTPEQAWKLIDLFLDDELPMDLASEFKQAMFEDTALREEVSSLRHVREALSEALANDEMTEEQRHRVYARIIAETAAASETLQAPSTQLSLPIRQENPGLRLNRETEE